MIALVLSFFIGPPAWVTRLQTGAQAIISTENRPLAKSHIESMMRALAPTLNSPHVIPVKGAPGQFIISALNPPTESCALLVNRGRKLSLVDWSREESPRPSCEVTQVELRNGTLIVGGKVGWVGNGPGFLIRTMVQRRGVWQTSSMASSARQCDSCLWSKAGNTYRVRTRDYPLHMSTGHVDAVYSREEVFTFRNGKILRTGERPLATPFNTLDALAGGLALQDSSSLRRIVPSASMRQQLAKVWKVVGPEPGVSVPGSTFNADSVTWGWHALAGDWHRDYWFHFVRRGDRWVVSRID